MAQNFNGSITVDGSVAVGSKKLVRSSTIVVGLESMGYSEGSVDVLIKATDDASSKIIEAVAKLPSIGGEIKFLEGTYVISSAIDISKPIRITGCGLKNTIIDGNIPLIPGRHLIKANSSLVMDNIKLRNNGQYLYCVVINQSVYTSFTDCEFETNNSFNDGIQIISGIVPDLHINNCINLTIAGKTSSNWQSIWIDGVASSPDGKITKCLDGRMEYRYVIRGTVTVNTPWGTLFESPVINLGTFDIPFISKPIVICTPECAGFHEGITSITNSNAGDTYILRPLSTPTFNFTLLVLAVGRWK